ncbi:MAG: DNA-packaging protein [Tannerellaceae bacterium]|jgi:hypothetical protein|nr:DNA-packaging protein [Tannerellaceae bacterium]
MSAEKGSKYWTRRNKHGRPRLYASPDALFDAAGEYFEWCSAHPLYKIETCIGKEGPIQVKIPVARPYTVGGLCKHLGYNRSHFYRCVKLARDRNISKSEDRYLFMFEFIHTIISAQQWEGAMMGVFSPSLVSRRYMGTGKGKKESAICPASVE